MAYLTLKAALVKQLVGLYTVALTAISNALCLLKVMMPACTEETKRFFVVFRLLKQQSKTKIMYSRQFLYETL